ncbi:MAG TPA: CBS domain-containing protein, partial [Kribbellaceae bacterium]
VAPRSRRPAFPVVDLDGRPTGTVSLGALGRVPAALRASTLLADVQVPLKNVPVVHPGDSLAELHARMPSRVDALALVTDEAGRLVGVVTAFDAARAAQLPGQLPGGAQPPGQDAASRP